MNLERLLKVLLLSLFLAGSGVHGYAQLRMPVCGAYADYYNRDTINVTTFGASTVEGQGGLLNFQLPLRSFIERCYKNKVINFYNFGIGGQTTAEGLSRFDAAIAGKTGFLMILMGVNDAVQITDRRGSVAATVSNMRTMILKAQSNKLNVILGTLQYYLLPQGDRPQDRQTRLLFQRRNFFIDRINAEYKKLAAELDVQIADINPVIGQNRGLFADIVHPNVRGYHVMALVWFDALNQEIQTYYLGIKVAQNYPNPANTFTKLVFTLSTAGKIKVVLYNIQGQNMGVVFEDFRNAGYHEEEISTARYPAGIYILNYELLNMRFQKKIIIAH